MKEKKIILGITGGIAAYKSCEIIRELIKKGIGVYVVLTKNATEFITPLTFKTLSGNLVYMDMYGENKNYAMPHIKLSTKCDLMVIAPATANIIGKIANGIADDLLSTLALSFRNKILIAPAMNSNMYVNPIVQENLKKLKKYKDRYRIIEPEQGELACGEIGIGKLAEVKKIVEEVINEIE